MAAAPAAPTPGPAAFPVRRHLLAGWIVVALFAACLLGWTVHVPLASAVIASGELAVESSRKVVQHLEGGIVAALHVRDGDRVVAGQPLVQLDTTAAQTRLSVIRNRIDTLLAAQARLGAERDGSEDVHFGEALVSRGADPRVADLLHRQTELFRSRRSAIQGQVDLLQKKAEILRQQIRGLEGQRLAKDRQIALVAREHGNLKTLYEKGIVPVTRILALERAAAQLSGERSSHISEIAKTEKEIGESELRIIQLRKDYLNQVVAELDEIEKNLSDLREQEVAALDVLRRCTVTAPAPGVVVDLGVRTRGEVVAAGGRLLEIVPDTDSLIAQARVRPQDIDSVAVGQKADIRLTAFDQKTTPSFPASVIYVSADRLETARDRQPYYAVRLRIERDRIAALGRSRLMPGMPAEIFIKSGERTMLSYIVKPLKDALSRAMREE